jgi:hypothetical protein
MYRTKLKTRDYGLRLAVHMVGHSDILNLDCPIVPQLNAPVLHELPNTKSIVPVLLCHP